MQAIVTKYLAPTNTKPSRIKASCERGSITVTYDHGEKSPHIVAADALVAKFIAEDVERYGSRPENNSWAKRRVMGSIGSGLEAHVFIA